MATACAMRTELTPSADIAIISESVWSRPRAMTTPRKSVIGTSTSSAIAVRNSTRKAIVREGSRPSTTSARKRASR